MSVIQPGILLLLVAMAATSLPGCDRATPAAQRQAGATALAPAAAAKPLLVVTKNPTCGCCVAWVDAMRRAGFDVQVHDVDNLDPIKTQVGIPVGKGSCHTAQVGGYFIEGHVPAEDIERLLTERPDAKGLVLPGMPPGAPGMEVPGSNRPYTVELVRRDGTTVPYAAHGVSER